MNSEILGTGFLSLFSLEEHTRADPASCPHRASINFIYCSHCDVAIIWRLIWVALLLVDGIGPGRLDEDDGGPKTFVAFIRTASPPAHAHRFSGNIINITGVAQNLFSNALRYGRHPELWQRLRPLQTRLQTRPRLRAVVAMSGPPSLSLRSSFGSGSGPGVPSMPPARSRSSDRASAAQQRHARAAVSFTSLAQSFAQLRDVLENPNEHNITPQEMVRTHSTRRRAEGECGRERSGSDRTALIHLCGTPLCVVVLCRATCSTICHPVCWRPFAASIRRRANRRRCWRRDACRAHSQRPHPPAQMHRRSPRRCCMKSGRKSSRNSAQRWSDRRRAQAEPPHLLPLLLSLLRRCQQLLIVMHLSCPMLPASGLGSSALHSHPTAAALACPSFSSRREAGGCVVAVGVRGVAVESGPRDGEHRGCVVVSVRRRLAFA